MTDFEDKVLDLVHEEASKIAEEEFISFIVGDWEEGDLGEMMGIIRKKMGDVEANMVIFYLFGQLLREGNLRFDYSFHKEDYDDPDEKVIMEDFKEVPSYYEGHANTQTITHKKLDITMVLKDVNGREGFHLP